MRFQILDDPNVVATIDVLETPAARLDDLMRVLAELLEAARDDPDFLGGALHRGLSPLRQPLVWLPGAVPLTRRFVALYARWRSDGHRRGFAGVGRGRELLLRGADISGAALLMIEAPEASLYVPTLVDSTGELCPRQDDCADGRDAGPIVDDANPRAPFINLFRTTPDRQQRLLEATYAIMPIARKHDGYLRTALHRSLDGLKVANYGQYREVEQIRAMYFHGRTAAAFAGLLFADVTAPTGLFGLPLRWRGRPLGSTPRLRCYTIDRVVLPVGIPEAAVPADPTTLASRADQPRAPDQRAATDAAGCSSVRAR